MKLPSPTHLLQSLVWRSLDPCVLTLVVLAVIVSGPSKAHSQAVVETPAAVFARIKAAVEQNTHGKVSVGAIVPTAIPGVYEVTVGNEVMYVDATGRYALDGRMVDMLEQRDLTAARLEQLNRIDFQKLPLDLAIKTVHGNGKRMMAVFEDPACPVCRALSKFVDQIPDVTVYRFMYPVIDPSSIPRAQAAWCAKDRKAAWAGLMKGGPAPSAAPCDTTGLRRIVALGEQLQINGTPTVFLGDGRRLVGATPPDQFMAALDESAR